jgi:hypothetical protein
VNVANDAVPDDGGTEDADGDAVRAAAR